MAAEHEAISSSKLRPCSVVSSVSSAAGLRGVGARGCGVWGAVAAELVGTALLVLLPCLCAADLPPTHTALAVGATVTMLVQCFDHLSFAMFNPAVSLTGALMQKISWKRAAAYLAAQVTGGIVGAYVLQVLAGSESCSRCVTMPASGLHCGRAAAVEAALTSCLALACCAAWDRRAPSSGDSWPLRIGTTVAALVLAAFPLSTTSRVRVLQGSLTGASMNPARSLGPALLAGRLRHHWVYWAGPLSGAAAACLLYRGLWAPPPAPPLPHAQTHVHVHV